MWTCINIYEYAWIYIIECESVQIYMNIYEHTWMYTECV